MSQTGSPAGASRALRRTLLGVAAIAVAAGAAALLHVSRPGAPAVPESSGAPPDLARTLAHPIVLIGLDGADWQIAGPLIDAGKLPNLARLRRDGLSGSMRSAPPLLSPLLWTTAATGKSPEKHGIVDFLVPDEATGEKAPISSKYRRVKALWNIFSERGLSSAFVAWWATWPAEPIRGAIVSDRVAYSLFDVRDVGRGDAALVSPAALGPAVRARVVRPADVTDAEIERLAAVGPEEIRAARAAAARGGDDASRDRLVHLLRIVAAARTYHAVALDILRLGQPDLFSIYYQGIDEVSHRFEHCSDPPLPACGAADAARYARTVGAYYEVQDAMLGEILAAVDPASYVLVISDHGFRNGGDRPKDDTPDIAGKPAKWHRPYGIAALAGPGISEGSLESVTLMDIAPTVLALAGLPAAADMPGHALVSLPGAAKAAPIPSYGPLDRAPAVAAAAPAGDQEDAEGREAMLENLRSLGYIGSAGKGSGTAEAGAAPGGEIDGATPETLTAHTNVGALHLQKNETAEAAREFEAALKLKDDYPPALIGLAGVRVREGEISEAEALTLRAIESSPSVEGGLYIQYAGLAIQTHSAAGARGTLERLGAARPAVSEIPVALAVLALDSGGVGEAEALLREGLRLEPTSTEAMTRLFQMKLRAGAEPSLEGDLRRALAENPASVLHHNWLGLILQKSGDAAGAEREFKAALATAPDFGGTMANLGALYGRTGRLAEAVDVLSRALRIDPGDLECRVNLGAALGKLGRTDEALAVLQKGVAPGDAPPAPELLDAMAVAWAQKGEVRRAADLLRQSLALNPDQPRVWEMLKELAGDR
ncbi:MAG: alkaline phosphatase family protein [Acidobacteria bacterium]|nr:alkaline phosphatase family protein [Acidobacteriota bacterium]